MHAARTHLSKYIKRVESGETIVVCRRNIPVAEIRPLPRLPGRKRIGGFDKGKIRIPPSFFAPLPGDLMALFNGEGS